MSDRVEDRFSNVPEKVHERAETMVLKILENLKGATEVTAAEVRRTIHKEKNKALRPSDEYLRSLLSAEGITVIEAVRQVSTRVNQATESYERRLGMVAGTIYKILEQQADREKSLSDLLADENIVIEINGVFVMHRAPKNTYYPAEKVWARMVQNHSNLADSPAKGAFIDLFTPEKITERAEKIRETIRIRREARNANWKARK